MYPSTSQGQPRAKGVRAVEPATGQLLPSSNTNTRISDATTNPTFGAAGVVGALGPVAVASPDAHWDQLRSQAQLLDQAHLLSQAHLLQQLLAQQEGDRLDVDSEIKLALAGAVLPSPSPGNAADPTSAVGVLGAPMPASSKAAAGGIGSSASSSRGMFTQEDESSGPRALADASNRFLGQIRTFNQEKGFGFVHSEEAARACGCASSDIYLHYTQAINFRYCLFLRGDLHGGVKKQEQGLPHLVQNGR